MTRSEITKQALALPPEERASLVDSLIESLCPSVPEAEREWVATARQRLEEIRSGHTRSIPGSEVTAKINKRYGL